MAVLTITNKAADEIAERLSAPYICIYQTCRAFIQHRLDRKSVV